MAQKAFSYSHIFNITDCRQPLPPGRPPARWGPYSPIAPKLDPLAKNVLATFEEMNSSRPPRYSFERISRDSGSPPPKQDTTEGLPYGIGWDVKFRRKTHDFVADTFGESEIPKSSATC